MRKLWWVILFLLLSFTAEAHHIIGGEMSYIYLSKNGDDYTYQIVLKLYRGTEPVDNNHAPLDPTVKFAIYNDDDGTLYKTILNIPLNGPIYPNKQSNDPCIINPPAVNYEYGKYLARVTLPVNEHGYTIAFQRCCRSDLLLNVHTENDVGATYFTHVPGTENGIPGDNSPVFNQEEAILICSKGQVNYTYAATDPDGDKLVYSFVPGYVGGSRDNTVPVAAPPPYQTFNYKSGFSGVSPLGPGVTIDSLTGTIHGRTNLQPGTYDVCVQVRSYRKGRLLGVHLKDFQFEVYDCQRVALADIPTLYNNCASATIHFPDHSTPGKSYLWNFGDGTTSTEYTPTHTYQDTGTYHLWLKVDPASSCGDSIGAVAKIYPGLKADFSPLGNCLQFPTKFKETSLNKYGNINSRSWDFGDTGNSADTSHEINPVYQYKRPDTYPVVLKVTTDKGCVQSDTQSLKIYDKPPLTITNDTIVCYKDEFQLKAQSILNGSYQWQPLYRITGQNTPMPKVHPLKDTTYKVTFTDAEGCVNTDSVHLRVKTTLIVHAGNDTTICKGDPVMLHATSDDDYAFTWYNTAHEVVATTRDFGPAPVQNETYTVEATLGSCEASDAMNARVVPYPVPVAEPDTNICYGDKIQLHGGGGAFYHWSPGTELSDSMIASPVASPSDSTLYTLTVTDTLGCPKPVSKSVSVGVVPPVPAFAGNDTIITIGQIFQLHATGGNKYAWTPAFGLSDPGIADPLVNWNKDIQYRVKVIQAPEGCFAYDSVNVRYIVGPAIYVPSAFTPNGDGKNDVFRPIPVGVTHIDYFRVYNRWGQLVFKTTQYMQGWNGYFKGKPADAGGYVWMVKGEDFRGNEIVKKGTVLLIR